MDRVGQRDIERDNMRDRYRASEEDLEWVFVEEVDASFHSSGFAEEEELLKQEDVTKTLLPPGQYSEAVLS